MAFHLDDDYSHATDIARWLMLAIMILVVGLRIYCRTSFGKNRLGLDDGITGFCVVISLVSCILMTVARANGAGQHTWTLSESQRVQALKWNIILDSVFAIICILKRILNYGEWTAVAFWGMCLSCQAGILATSVCPVAHGWDPSVPGTCADAKVLIDIGYFMSVYSCFLDLLLAFYPVPFIMRLKLPLKSRVAISVGMGLTSLAFAVSLYKLIRFGDIFALAAVDPAFPIPYLDLLAFTEACILIVCASIPTLGPFYRQVGDWWREPKGDSKRSEEHTGSYDSEATFAHQGEAQNRRFTDEIPLVRITSNSNEAEEQVIDQAGYHSS
ncbi:hypothetical protein PG988_007806 [Apiospora saccharicola]